MVFLQAMNQFQVLSPSVLLAPYVKQYWFVTMDNVCEGVQRLVPMGCMVLSFQRANRTYSSRERNFLPQSHVAGMTTHYTDLRFSGKIDFVCIVFQPGGARSFFRRPVSEFSCNNLPLDALGDPEFCELESRVCETRSNQECVEHIEQFLLRRLSNLRGTTVCCGDKRMRAVIRSIGQGETNVGKLAETACLGYKQFKRVFWENMGMNPKDLLRITRFQRVYQALQQHTPLTLEQLAETYGYYDKSHVIKELKGLCGFTPAALHEACDAVYSPYHALFRSAFVDLPAGAEIGITSSPPPLSDLS